MTFNLDYAYVKQPTAIFNLVCGLACQQNNAILVCYMFRKNGKCFLFVVAQKTACQVSGIHYYKQYVTKSHIQHTLQYVKYSSENSCLNLAALRVTI